MLILVFDFERFKSKSINGVFKAIEQIISYAESHRISHSEAFEEIKVKLFLLLTFIIIVIICPVMNLYLIWLKLLRIFHAHTVRSK